MDAQVFRSREQFLEDAPKLVKRISAFWNFDQPLELSYKPWTERRSKAQLGLYRTWLRHMADYFTTREHQFTDDDIHDLVRHKFLGYEDKLVGSTEIKGQLKSTANGKIGKTDMSEFMHQIDVWCTELGCYLPYPDENEYTQYKKART